MIRGRLSGVLAIGLFVLVACGGGDDNDAQGCKDNSGCTAPATCIDHVCRVACTTNAQCSDKEFCDVENGVCKAGCATDSECEQGKVCRKGSCLSATGDLDSDGFPAQFDCDDLNAKVYPNASETCNGLDDNCNNKIDDGLPPGDLADLQKGVCINAHKVCGGKAGYVEPDYEDLYPLYEDKEAACDGLDNDCDGYADNNLPAEPGDKAFGVCASAVKTCAGANGWQEPDYTKFTGYESYETGGCDGIDSNCDGAADEGYDQDGDGYYTKDDPQCKTFYTPKGLVDCDDEQPKFGKTCVIYVDDTATGLGDGTSWANAITNLQDALKTAKTGYQLWVAAGTYKPDVGVGVTALNRSATFQLLGDIEIYGGFKGGETTLSARDFRVNKTVLSGDLAGNDAPNFTNMEDNSYHIMKGAKGALVDGFWISGGSASDSGGALHNDGPNDDVTFANCTFTNNRASGDGGAIYSYWDSKTTLINTKFVRNKAGGSGGAIYTNWSSEPKIYGSLFVGNTATTSGGALACKWFSDKAVIVNSTFASNSAASAGAIFLENAADIVNSVIYGNGAASVGSASVTLSYTSIEGGALGTGNTNLSASPFVDLDGADGVAGNLDDDLHLAVGSSSIDSGNNAMVPLVLTFDLDGNPRLKGTVDRGAFERP